MTLSTIAVTRWKSSTCSSLTPLLHLTLTLSLSLFLSLSPPTFTTNAMAESAPKRAVRRTAVLFLEKKRRICLASLFLLFC